MSIFEEQEYNKNLDWKLWKKLFQFTISYKKQMIIIAVFMLGLAGVDVIFPLMSKYAIDHFVVPASTDGLVRFGLIYFGLIVIQSINIYFFIALAGRVEMGLTYDIRKAGFQHLQELSFNYYDKTPVGWLMARMTSDGQR